MNRKRTRRKTKRKYTRKLSNKKKHTMNLRSSNIMANQKVRRIETNTRKGGVNF